MKVYCGIISSFSDAENLTMCDWLIAESELDGQCLDGDEECAATLSERTRGKSKTRTKSAYAAVKKSVAQSFLKPGEWILMFPVILFFQFFSVK